MEFVLFMDILFYIGYLFYWGGGSVSGSFLMWWLVEVGVNLLGLWLSCCSVGYVVFFNEMGSVFLFFLMVLGFGGGF